MRGIDVKTVPGLKIGYVMGVGDQVPAGIAQLGYDVTLQGRFGKTPIRIEIEVSTTAGEIP